MHALNRIKLRSKFKTMNVNQLEESAEEQAEKVKNQVAGSVECARSMAEGVRVRSCDCLASARGEFRSHPISYMAGALLFGFAVGCVVMSGRHPVSRQQRFLDKSMDHANDFVSNAHDKFSHAASNLKFW